MPYRAMTPVDGRPVPAAPPVVYGRWQRLRCFLGGHQPFDTGYWSKLGIYEGPLHACACEQLWQLRAGRLVRVHFNGNAPRCLCAHLITQHRRRAIEHDGAAVDHAGACVEAGCVCTHARPAVLLQIMARPPVSDATGRKET